MRVFDFFSGCGGTSLGFRQFGFEIVGALDFDKHAADTYRHNFPKTFFFETDIRVLAADALSDLIGKRKEPLLFCGCAPCQPFSRQRKLLPKNDVRKNLLLEFQRFVEFWKPEYIFLENVPGIQKVDATDGVFKTFIKSLSKMNYNFDYTVVKASEFGVPQTRRRLVLVAAREGKSLKSIDDVIAASNTELRNVRDYIQDLPPIEAGQVHASILNHAATKLSPINLKRIALTPEGGDRRNWPSDLHAACHDNYSGHTDVYGRMSWDKPASTLTTKCVSYSNGRFGHPEQNRAISLREAARLQTFPDDFFFPGSLLSGARQVGNAVPPLMAKTLSNCFI